MRKRLLFLPLTLLCFLFTGCFDIVEEILLNKDGSGKYTYTMDLSNMMNDPLMKGMLEADGADPFGDMDSTIYLKDLPDSVIGENRELWSRVRFHIFSSKEPSKFLTTIHFDFKHPEEIAYVTGNLDKVMKSGAANPLVEGSGLESPPSLLSGQGIFYSLTGKEFTRKSEELDGASETEEQLEMLKGFMEGATYTLHYAMPGKVEKVTIPNAKVDGNKVTVEASMLDLIEKKVSLDGVIRFK